MEILNWAIGTRVKIREDLKPNCLYGGTMFMEEMLPYIGETATIMNYEQEEDCSPAYLLDVDDEFWSWNEVMLERVEPLTPFEKFKADVAACNEPIELQGLIDGLQVAALMYCKEYHPQEVTGNAVTIYGMNKYLLNK